MIPVEEAVDLVLSHCPVFPSVEKAVVDLGHDVLAEDIHAARDIPYFSNSAMDGFAVVAKDTQSVPATLRLTGHIQAGDFPGMTVKSGEAVKIMTGAPMPEGADAVVMVEFTETEGENITVRKPVVPCENVRFQGEEIRKGEKGLDKGTILNPAAVGFLSALGRKTTLVHDKPSVSVLVTGNELVNAGEPLRPGQIWESNSVLLKMALGYENIEPLMLGIGRDDPVDLENKIIRGLETTDILLVCGGISVGDYDFVQKILLKLGVEKVFWRVAIKPGKPTFFGLSKEKLVFGLPGNPASVLVTYLVFVLPAVRKMRGFTRPFLQQEEARLDADVHKKPERLNFFRGILRKEEDGYHVLPAGKQNSHMLESFSSANCLILLDKGKSDFFKGETVRIQVLPWGLFT